MKILKGALEMARAAAQDSEVPLWLVGDGGLVTDVVIANFASYRRCMIPVGMHRYGKVITKLDRTLEPGLNLVGKNGEWRFVDEDGAPVPVDVVDIPGTEEK